MIKQHLYDSIKMMTAISIAMSALLLPTAALAQDSSDDIESLFSGEDAPPASVNEKEADPKASNLKDVKDLGQLSEFKDVAVIQRRYLPKTGRFEFFIGPSVIVNEAFFLNFGLSAKLGYYFSERFGIEFLYTGFTTSERSVTTDLREKLNVTTTSLVTPKSYMGADFKWSPIYGKMSWRNKTITPYDMYFSGGAGMTETNQGGSELTFHLGTGQTFALSKSTAIRWDFSWNAYSAKSNVSATSAASTYNNLLVTFGMSFFFPEATYR